jgi:hypothetical protein
MRSRGADCIHNAFAANQSKENAADEAWRAPPSDSSGGDGAGGLDGRSARSPERLLRWMTGEARKAAHCHQVRCRPTWRCIPSSCSAAATISATSSYAYDANSQQAEDQIERHAKRVRFTYDQEAGHPWRTERAHRRHPGRLKFGPDGMLYYATGAQGGNQFANFCRPVGAQVLPAAHEISAKDWSSHTGKFSASAGPRPRPPGVQLHRMRTKPISLSGQAPKRLRPPASVARNSATEIRSWGRVRGRAAADLARTRELVERETAAQATLDEAQPAFDIAEADVEVAQAALRTAELDLSYTRITAPIARRPVHAGQSGRTGIGCARAACPARSDPRHVQQGTDGGGAIDPNALPDRIRRKRGESADRNRRGAHRLPNPDHMLIPKQFVTLISREERGPDPARRAAICGPIQCVSG